MGLVFHSFNQFGQQLPTFFYFLPIDSPEEPNFFLSLGVLGLTVLTWLLPLLAASGGYESYARSSRELFLYQLGKTSIFYGIPFLKFLKICGKLLVWSFLLGMGLGTLALFKLNKEAIAKRGWFFLLWILPPMLFYALFHLPKPGYLLTFLSALCLLAARGLESFSIKRQKPFLGVVILSYLLTFTLVRQFPNEGFGKFCNAALSEYSLVAIRNRDVQIGDLIHSVRQNFNPQTHTLVTEDWSGTQNPYHFRLLRQVMFYLPEFEVLEIANPLQTPSVFRVKNYCALEKSFRQHEYDRYFNVAERDSGVGPLVVYTQTPKLVFLIGDFIHDLPKYAYTTFNTPHNARLYEAVIPDAGYIYAHVRFTPRPFD